MSAFEPRDEVDEVQKLYLFCSSELLLETILLSERRQPLNKG